MMRLERALEAWGMPDFEATLKDEIEGLDAGLLPLQQGLAAGSYALDSGHRARVISSTELGDVIRAKIGLFYASVIAGCSCADDPTPVDEIAEYCEVQFDIDRKTAEATVTLLPD